MHLNNLCEFSKLLARAFTDTREKSKTTTHTLALLRANFIPRWAKAKRNFLSAAPPPKNCCWLIPQTTFTVTQAPNWPITWRN